MSLDTTNAPPQPSELCTGRQLVERNPHLLNNHRVAWALRNRDKNGLAKSQAVFESPCGTLLVHEGKFWEWFLGLAGQAKPRRLRRRQRAEAVAS